MTLNINRLIQKRLDADCDDLREIFSRVRTIIRDEVKLIHKYLKAFNTILKDRHEAGLLPLYDAGFVSPDRQYLTVGINGLVESAEYIGFPITSSSKYYAQYINAVLETIRQCNVEDREPGIMFNTEYVPAENLGVKNAKWDARDGLFVPRTCYNSYFYLVEDTSTNVLDKFIMHGEKFTKHLDGGSALHVNLDEHLDKDQYRNCLNVMIKTGCPYATFNIPNTVCRDCGHIDKNKHDTCPKCGSENIDYATRIIGYLKLVSKWSEERQKEEGRRYYAKGI